MALTDAQVLLLNTMCPTAQNVLLGNFVKQAQMTLFTQGNKFYLDPVNGSDNNDGLTFQTAKLTLLAAYTLLTANQNDTLYIIGGASSVVLAAAFTWDKSYTHLVGLGGNLKFGGRCRIGHAGTAMSPMFTITGNGCIFSNIHFQHGQASATNLICVDIGDGTSSHGLRNYFDNCHFESSLDSVASGGSYAWRAVQIELHAEANEFNNCTFGSWSQVWASTAGALVYFMGDNADTQFRGCDFISNTSSTSMKIVDFAVYDNGGYSGMLFKECHFSNRNAAPANVFGTPTNGWIEMVRCTGTNFTKWSATSSTFVNMNGTTNVTDGGKGVTEA